MLARAELDQFPSRISIRKVFVAGRSDGLKSRLNADSIPTCPFTNERSVRAVRAFSASAAEVVALRRQTHR